MLLKISCSDRPARSLVAIPTELPCGQLRLIYPTSDVQFRFCNMAEKDFRMKHAFIGVQKKTANEIAPFIT
jgi:hypothetical protein